LLVRYRSLAKIVVSEEDDEGVVLVEIERDFRQGNFSPAQLVFMRNNGAKLKTYMELPDFMIPAGEIQEDQARNAQVEEWLTADHPVLRQYQEQINRNIRQALASRE
jgi:hypothetical protein